VGAPFSGQRDKSEAFNLLGIVQHFRLTNRTTQGRRLQDHLPDLQFLHRYNQFPSRKFRQDHRPRAATICRRGIAEYGLESPTQFQ